MARFSGPRRIAALALLVGVPLSAMLVVRATCADEDLELWLARLLFWTMPVVLTFVVVGAVMAWRESSASLGVALRRTAPGAAYVVALTVLVFVVVPPQMRVQFDETTLAGVSKAMYEHEACLVTTGALPVDGEVFPRENTVDKRPPLCAFFVHLVHRVTGMRVANAFWVNGALLAGGLLAAFLFVRSRLGVLAAVAAPLCILSVPIIGAAATSAGFDLMATVWLFVAVTAAIDFVARPGHGRFYWLMSANMLLAQSRYESLLFAGLIALIVFVRVRHRYRPSMGGAALLALAPVLVLPVVFLLLHSRNPKFYPEAEGAALLGWTYIGEHIGPLAGAWFAPSLANPFPGWLAIAGLLAWGLRLRKSQAGFADGLIAVVVIGTTLVSLAWFYGDVREPNAVRLYLPLAWATALAPLLAFQWLRPRAAVVLLAVMVAFGGLRIGELASGRAVAASPMANVTAELDALVGALPGEVGTTLWVGAPAHHLILHGHAALTAIGFDRRRADLQMLANRGDLRHVYFLRTTIDEPLAPSLGDVADLLQDLAVEAVTPGGEPGTIQVYRMKR